MRVDFYRHSQRDNDNFGKCLEFMTYYNQFE